MRMPTLSGKNSDPHDGPGRAGPAFRFPGNGPGGTPGRQRPACFDAVDGIPGPAKEGAALQKPADAEEEPAAAPVQKKTVPAKKKTAQKAPPKKAAPGPADHGEKR